ncbi:hypothetical protein E3T55_12165 [Cryobacterium frigoriphilum]|uniref:Uncharacterized protein n=1 Tax=Cryobacterium frigoriphilum TaxID=1259150 RepID=A0A4R8ZYH8_9MICO|nr:hypothetical protein [Cryobacterium frigoriphilum]TFD48808.1 hypothetical protein E3T55_12165 [Cryobacterium frigoriphilum]
MPLRGLSIHTVPASHTVSSRRTRATISEPDIGSTTELSPTEWMVSDSSTAVGSSSAILGFIQLVGGSYEVTRIGGSLIEFSTFLSLTDAVAALSAKPLRRLNLVAAPPRR